LTEARAASTPFFSIVALYVFGGEALRGFGRVGQVGRVGLVGLVGSRLDATEAEDHGTNRRASRWRVQRLD
jgi:hypothetical protein